MTVLATPAPAAPIQKTTGSLITAEQLNTIIHQDDASWLVVDVRTRVNFALGHIPSAANLWRPDYEADENEYPFTGMGADREKMEQLLSRLGVTPDTLLVLYDDGNNTDSARLWWILKLYGHSRVVLLDGGLHAWKKKKYPVKMISQRTVIPSQYRFDHQQAKPEWLASLEQVKLLLKKNERTILLDVRAEDEVTGTRKKSGAFRKGRIPSSQWLEYTQVLDENGFLSAPELQKLFDRHGITPDHKIITYCQSGVRSANTLFVLTQLLHYPNVSNYDGSWVEWSWHKELAIETGLPGL